GLLLVFMGVLLVPSYGRRSPFKSALLLIALTVVYLALVELANLREDRTRALLVAAALVLTWLRFAGYIQLAFFSRSLQVDIARNRNVGYTRSALVGGAFALGWTPCIGPILGGILGLAASTSATTGDAWTATYLLAFYSAGLSVPFLITGLALSDATRVMKKLNPYLPIIEVASGLLLIAVGTLLLSGRLTALNEYFTFSDFNQGL
ncbi:MAG TPA: cytochrome c biogenesis protein CcdA, partial [Tepidiformaceae bacterium]|nr:cytochrome c biogenesis protein CcdA [Tepidiformaceae bacterium]